MKAKLISKNVTISGRRTSLRLERASWEALGDICKCEKLTVHELCSLIDNARRGSSRTSAVRAFIVTYFPRWPWSAVRSPAAQRRRFCRN